MTCQCRSMSRTLAASSTQRLVSQAQGQSGSNQKSTRAVVGALWTASVIVGVLLEVSGAAREPALSSLPIRIGPGLFPGPVDGGNRVSHRRGKLARVAVPRT